MNRVGCANYGGSWAVGHSLARSESDFECLIFTKYKTPYRLMHIIFYISDDDEKQNKFRKVN